MPSRRISALADLAPRQHVAVNPYSPYNSDNVNMLTRIVSGGAHSDKVVSGMTVYGDSRVSETLATAIIDDDFSYASTAAMEAVWNSDNFEIDTGTALTVIPGGDSYASCVMYQDIPSLSAADIYKSYKLSFKLTGGTPRQIKIAFGGQIKVLNYPSASATVRELDFQLDKIYTEGGNPLDPRLTIIVFIDSSDSYSDAFCRLDDITFQEIVTPGGVVAALDDPDLVEEDLPEAYLHPHEVFNIDAGICIKDDIMINFVGLNPDLEPAASLTYGNADSWLGGVPFGVTEFPNGNTQTFFGVGGTTTFDSNGELVLDSLDDGEVSGPRKVDGDTTVSAVQWAYLCVYYSYYKNPNPNKAYLGIATEAEVEDARYAEDYLPIAKLRFIDANTVDAIILIEKEAQFLIDAIDVSYMYLNDIDDWPEGRPPNVSVALDYLAARNGKGLLLFQTYTQFTDWLTGGATTGVGLPTGTVDGDGVDTGFTRVGGQVGKRDVNSTAYILETGQYFRARYSEDGGEADGIEKDGNGDPILIWFEDQLAFQVNWNNDWPTHSAAINSAYTKTLDTTLANAQGEWTPEDGTDVLVTASDRQSEFEITNPASGGGSIYVNPYNPYGYGMVKGPTQTEVSQNAFLRADGLWIPSVTTGSIVPYYEFDLDPSAINLDEELPNAPGWLLCYGQQVTKAAFEALFYKILGAGGAGTTFNVPDLRGRFIVGHNDDTSGPGPIDDSGDYDTIGEPGGVKVAELLQHNHTNGTLDVGGSISGDGGHAHTYSAHSERTDLAATGSESARIAPTGTNYYHTGSSSGFATGGVGDLTEGYHSHAITGLTVTGAMDNAGESAPDNRPPYLTVFYIIKT